jgi:hypothetical protein
VFQFFSNLPSWCGFLVAPIRAIEDESTGGSFWYVLTMNFTKQQRIVAKVDELLRWCDALEARLTAAQTTAATLLDTTLHQILSA